MFEARPQSPKRNGRLRADGRAAQSAAGEQDLLSTENLLNMPADITAKPAQPPRAKSKTSDFSAFDPLNKPAKPVQANPPQVEQERRSVEAQQARPPVSTEDMESGTTTIEEMLMDSTGESHAEATGTSRSTFGGGHKEERGHFGVAKQASNSKRPLLPRTREDFRRGDHDDHSDDEDDSPSVAGRASSSATSSGTKGSSPHPSESRFARLRRAIGKIREDEPDRIAFTRNKRHSQFAGLRLNQVIDAHPSQIWKLEFNKNGSFLASSGHDRIVRVWRVINHPDAEEEMRRTEDRRRKAQRSRGARADSDLVAPSQQPIKPEDIPVNPSSVLECKYFRPLFLPAPHRIFAGHTNDIIDMSWSYSNFLLTASLDCSVRLWHVSRDECFHIFWHSDTVTSVHFHPKKDRYFLSGCWDRKLRLWSIETKRVKEWAQTNDVPVTAKFSPAGDRVVSGLMYGQVFVFNFDDASGLRYFTQIECKNRQGKHRNGTKVTGIEFVQNSSLPHSSQRSAGGQFNMLITTNDSRLRYFNMYDFTQIAKYKGVRNTKLLIRARISEDGEHIICGSEDGHVIIWDTLSREAPGFLQKKDRNVSYEYFRATHSEEGIVCDACFVPTPAAFCMMQTNGLESNREESLETQVIVAADFEGKIRVYSRFYETASADESPGDAANHIRRPSR
eukprot:scaffold923_cov256-Pinguiococcus_pyrenoidosus.AAC.63